MVFISIMQAVEPLAYEQARTTSAGFHGELFGPWKVLKRQLCIILHHVPPHFESGGVILHFMI